MTARGCGAFSTGARHSHLAGEPPVALPPEGPRRPSSLERVADHEVPERLPDKLAPTRDAFYVPDCPAGKRHFARRLPFDRRARESSVARLRRLPPQAHHDGRERGAVGDAGNQVGHRLFVAHLERVVGERAYRTGGAQRLSRSASPRSSRVANRSSTDVSLMGTPRIRAHPRPLPSRGGRRRARHFPRRRRRTCSSRARCSPQPSRRRGR